MTASSNIRLTIEFNDPASNPEREDEQAQLLINDLQDKDIDFIDTVNRVPDSSSSDEAKSAGGFLVGLLMAEVKIDNAKKLFGYLRDRLGGKTIELTVEANGKKLSVKASSREELDYAIKAAQDFISK
ncbi:hypothetical protein [Chamaesiphon sp. VAR_48_metabat_135_sub]|uniref:hypothetical protein n=1 Tax=Chamaesiphon sp. VAR_48_metabat_135_sub TaxID=2964699 RepID=UPI00286A79EF|nr:hypothetical protein [Chamaesiphon sp. VAR_48_metabat_135_sub]